MKAAIVSDIHFGSRHCLHEALHAFVRSLPLDTTLVMNGDTVNSGSGRMPEEHRKVLAFLREQSFERRIIWIRGNHDERFTMPDPGTIEFAPSYDIDGKLFISHGHDFDNVMPRNRAFILLVRGIHRLRIALGAESVHVAFYAKRFRLLYDFLRRHVTANAVEYATENGYTTVICGHTHYPEDVMQDGIRYLNTGSWTEKPIFYVAVDDDRIELRKVRV